MELHEVCHTRRRLAGELEVVLTHPVIAPLLVEFGHHRKVVDDMLRRARCPKFFAPLGSWRVAITNRDVPPFANPDLRRAMSLSLDRKAFIDIISEGQGDIGAVMQPPPDG